VNEPELLIPFRDFAIALAIGALVGIEREKKQAEEQHRGIGGLRTFILFAQAGALAAWLADRFSAPWIFIAGAALVTAAVLVGYAVQARRQESFGLTTEMAAIVVYLLGGTAVAGYPELAVALAIVTSAVLAFKQPLHGVVERIGRDDLYAGLKLLIATFIVLPLLPDAPIDPWGALNPYRMWWLVILISLLSLVGYVASRWLGSRRGIPLAGLCGGMASSTAVSISFARRSREGPAGEGIAGLLATGLLLSWGVMFVRIGVEVAAICPELLRALWLPLLLLAALSGALAFASRRPGGAAGEARELPLRNPFSLMPAVRFAAVFAVVLLVVKLAGSHLRGSSLYWVAGLAGLTDVDAITLSLANYVGEGGDVALGAGAILLAGLSNTLAKLVIVLALGAPVLRRRVGVAAAALFAGAGLALVLQRWLAA
jgi:uncharacterized membrane protein (DUF4010 family)